MSIFTERFAASESVRNILRHALLYPTGVYALKSITLPESLTKIEPPKESREIKLRVLFKGEQYVAFEVAKISHTGARFIPAGHNCFNASNGFTLCHNPGLMPGFVDREKTLYIEEYMGRVEVSRSDFNRIEEAIKEYNERFYVWKPTREYFGVVIRENQAKVECFVWNNSDFDRRIYNQGLAFKTRKEAEEVCRELNEKYNSLLTQAVQKITKK